MLLTAEISNWRTRLLNNNITIALCMGELVKLVCMYYMFFLVVLLVLLTFRPSPPF